jgi:sugar/nucleoside kinase (ribokinase family)
MPANHKPIVVVGATQFPSRGETVPGSSFDIPPGGKGAAEHNLLCRAGMK